nr:retrovirus-related Pol polyprotein from transposon TNT 1-94 [Tanacetum cinerariifolium]
METMNVTFDELLAVAFEQRNSKPRLEGMTSRQISLGLDLTYAPSTITSQKLTEHDLDLLFEAMYDDCIGGLPSAASRTSPAAQAHQDVEELEPQQQHIQQQYDQALLQHEIVADNVSNAIIDGNTFELVPLLDNVKDLTLKWLFKNKHNEENTVIKNKTRLVVRGYRQEEGIDFEESFTRLLGPPIGLKLPLNYGVALTILHSSTWATNWFKRLVGYAKCNRDSYETFLAAMHVIHIEGCYDANQAARKHSKPVIRGIRMEKMQKNGEMNKIQLKPHYGTLEDITTNVASEGLRHNVDDAVTP